MQRPNQMADFLTKQIDSILPKRLGESIRIVDRNAVLTRLLSATDAAADSPTDEHDLTP